MIIKSITIANFKAIREPVKIDFKPITLLFGPNSSGKSTIIHALHYAWEVVGRHNLNPNYTSYGGDSVDLGGFENLVHGHDKKRSICIRFDLDLKNKVLPVYAAPEAIALTDTYQSKDYLSVLHWNSKINSSISAWVDFKISWNELDQAPFVSSYSVGIDDEYVAGIKTMGGGKAVEIAYLNFFHPVFHLEDEDNYFFEAVKDVYHGKTSYPFYETVNVLVDSANEAAQSYQKWLDSSFIPERWYAPLKRASEIIDKENKMRNEQTTIIGESPIDEAVEAYIPLKFWLLCRHFFNIQAIDGDVNIKFQEQHDALPKWGKKLDIAQGNKEDLNFETVAATISQILVGPGELLKDALSKLRYVGPIRSSINRNYLPNRYIEKYRWANGLAAWDALHQGKKDFIAQVNEWISKQLKCGYRIERKSYRELPSDGDFISKLDKSPLIRKIVLIDEKYGVEVTPPDIGTGITQVLPVIIAALYENRNLIAIEQPELHLHPAFQVALGDLFISQIQNNTEVVYLLETHSEHFILRLLRRIRETETENLPLDKWSLRPAQLAVYYVEEGVEGIKATEIRVDEEGEFIDRWPKGFFEEREEELLY